MMRKLSIKRAVATVVAALTVAVIGGLTNATPAAADICGGLPDACYQITVATGAAWDADTDANVYITLLGLVPGPDGRGDCRTESDTMLLHDGSDIFERNGVNTFMVFTGANLGQIQGVHIGHDDSGSDPSWQLDIVRVTNQASYAENWFYSRDWNNGHQWLATDHDDGSTNRLLGTHDGRDVFDCQPLPVSPELTVTVTPGGPGTAPVLTWTLSCDPVTGTHPNPADACAFVTTSSADLLDPVRLGKNQHCMQVISGYAVATVEGTWRGEPVNAQLARNNSCETARWNKLTPLIGDGFNY